MMHDNACVCCGRTIPEGRQVCTVCLRKGDMPQKYFRIRDDCGWTHYIQTDRMSLTASDIVLLTPHVIAATEITQEIFKEATQ